MEKISAMEIISLLETLEKVEPTRALSTEASTIDLIFFKAFGFDWDKNQLYKRIRKCIPNLMSLTETETKGYYSLV